MTRAQKETLRLAILVVLDWADKHGPVGEDWRVFEQLQLAALALNDHRSSPTRSRALIEVIE